jgi:hypothetical protein
MKTKALLVDAAAGFAGPWVFLDPGEWIVDTPPGIKLEIREGNNLAGFNSATTVRGPSKVRAIVSEDYTGKRLFLSARMVSDASVREAI